MFRDSGFSPRYTFGVLTPEQRRAAQEEDPQIQRIPEPDIDDPMFHEEPDDTVQRLIAESFAESRKLHKGSRRHPSNGK